MATGNKTTPIVVAAVAIVVGIIYFGANRQPANDEVTGTVAPAERYRADQITEDDINLGDQTVQQFMQTDTYDRIINDEALMAVLNSAEMQAVLNNGDHAARRCTTQVLSRRAAWSPS